MGKLEGKDSPCWAWPVAQGPDSGLVPGGHGAAHGAEWGQRVAVPQDDTRQRAGDAGLETTCGHGGRAALPPSGREAPPRLGSTCAGTPWACMGVRKRTPGKWALGRASWPSLLCEGWRPLKGGARGQGELLGVRAMTADPSLPAHPCRTGRRGIAALTCGLLYRPTVFPARASRLWFGKDVCRLSGKHRCAVPAALGCG